MGDMLIRDIPEPLKSEIEAAARKRGQSLSAKAIDLLRKGMIAEKRSDALPDKSAWDEIRADFVAGHAVDVQFAEELEKIEAERKLYFGRQSEI